ncbi:MAG: hypothetical protein ABIR71_12545 [Chthoniobacterales bacterium]
MIRLFRVVFLFCVGAALLGAAPAERSVSSSRQFIVHGPDARLRGAICELAERCKRDALRALGARDGWQTPIVIQAQPPDFTRAGAPVAQLQVNQTGAGLKFQLELRIPADIRVPEVERELLRAVLLEIIYRSAPDLPPGTPYVNPPDWLLEGLPALASERDGAAVAQILTTATAGEVPTLEKFLRQKRALLDSPSRTLYDAYSAALVSLLSERPEGRSRLAQFVADLDSASNDPLADLTAHFPALGSDALQIEKNWQASVARMAGSGRYRVLDCAETERQLAEVLRVSVPGPPEPTVYTLEEFAQFLRLPAAVPGLQRLTSDLLLLSGRAHPLYLPVIAEYQRIGAQLLRRKAPRPRRLAELRALREDLRRRMDAIADYVNWWEATQARTASGTFREYLRAAEEAVEPRPRRRDRISVYLDALEAQF